MGRDEHRLLQVLIRRCVTQVRLDYSVTLVFWSRELSVELRVEGPFAFLSGEEQTFRVEPENVKTVSPVLELFNRVVSEAAVQDGTLRIDFEGNVTISVPPLSKYEAWTLGASNGLKIVCMPGGELAIWSPVEGGMQ